MPGRGPFLCPSLRRARWVRQTAARMVWGRAADAAAGSPGASSRYPAGRPQARGPARGRGRRGAAVSAGTPRHTTATAHLMRRARRIVVAWVRVRRDNERLGRGFRTTAARGPAASPPAPPPQGTQDLLFEAARRLRRCEAALARFFEERGFAEVIPPALEAAEVFALASPHGETGGPRTVDRHGHLLAVRADFTAQVARIAATRLARVSPLRLYYRGSVIRETAAETGTARERLQAGCELVGVEG